MKMYVKGGKGIIGCTHINHTFVWQQGSLHLDHHHEAHIQCKKGCKLTHLSTEKGSIETVDVTIQELREYLSTLNLHPDDLADNLDFLDQLEKIESTIQAS